MTDHASARDSAHPQRSSTHVIHRPDRELRALFCSVALVFAPVAVMVATALDQTGADDTVAYLAQVSAGRGRYLIAGLLLALGMVALIPAAAGLDRLAARALHGRLLRAGALLLAFGGAFSGLAVSSGFAPSYEATAPGVPAVPVAYLDALNVSPWALLGFGVSGVGLGLGFVLTGVGLWRARVVPRWAALLCAAGPVTFVAPSTYALAAAAWLLVVIPFALASAALLRRPPGPVGEGRD